MPRRTACTTIILGFVLAFLSVLPALAAETSERILTHEGTLPDGGTLILENLVGAVTVIGGDRLHVEARVVAQAGSSEEAQALVDSVRLEHAAEGQDLRVHVEFPVTEHAAFRLPRAEAEGLVAKWVTPLLSRKTVATRYSDHTVEIGKVKGAVSLGVYMKVTVPHDAEVLVKHVFGPIHCTGLRGNVEIEGYVGRSIAHQIFGSLQVRTSSGDVEVWQFRGEQLRVQTASGDIQLQEVDAQRAELVTESGIIQGASMNVAQLQAKAASGDVLFEDVESTTMNVDVGSGAVDLQTFLKRTRELAIQSATGDVTLRLGKVVPFDFFAEIEKGSVTNKLPKVDVLEQTEQATRLQRGGGGPEVRVTSQGGEIVLRPTGGKTLFGVPLGRE